MRGVGQRSMMRSGEGETSMSSTVLQSRLGGLLREERLRHEPWRFAYFDAFLPAGRCRELSSLFGSSLSSCERRDGQKPYAFLTGPANRQALPPESPAGRLLRFLGGPRYRELVSAFTGIDLSRCDVSLDLWEYRSGHWLAPHVDKADKLVTQIVYLTEGWKEATGGRLLILHDADPSSVAEALPPRAGASAIIVRSDSSWHAVEPVSPEAAPRRSLTIIYRERADRAVKPEDPGERRPYGDRGRCAISTPC